jgi:hypothetical protein
MSIVLKTTLLPGYRVKLIQLAVGDDARNTSFSRFTARFLERLVDGKILSGEIPPISEEDIEKDLKMGTRELIQEAKKTPNRLTTHN